MVVVCRVSTCPYRSNNGFCRKKVLGITQSGMCGHIYNRKNQVKQNWQQQVPQEYKEREEVIDIDR